MVTLEPIFYSDGGILHEYFISPVSLKIKFGNDFCFYAYSENQGNSKLIAGGGYTRRKAVRRFSGISTGNAGIKIRLNNSGCKIILKSYGYTINLVVRSQCI